MSTEVEAALDQLAAAMDTLDPFARLPLATLSLAAGGFGSDQPAEARPFWLALHGITSGATPERLDHLVSVLDVVKPEIRWAYLVIAERSIEGDAPRANVWRAIVALLRAYGVKSG